MTDEGRSKHKGNGKWARDDVPKLGWTCIGIEDSCDDDGDEGLHVVCAMCEVTLIRYVHTMAHQDYPDLIQAGCICAGIMEGNPESALERENYAKRRDRFHTLKRWKRTPKGYRMGVEGFMLVVYSHGNGWKILVKGNGEMTFGKKVYTDANEAKRASLDALTYAKERH